MDTILNYDEEKSSILTGDCIEAIVRRAARKMLAVALEAEVNEFIQSHKGIRDSEGHQAVVRNGYMPERKIKSTCGDIPVRQPRIDDRKLPRGERFTSAILPKFMRRTPTLESVIPALYLNGLSTNRFTEALSSIFGEGAKGFCPSTIMRLKEVWTKEYEQWTGRRLDGKEYVYVWADGVYCNARLDHEKLCLLVIIGVAADGRKELLAVSQGIRESEVSWTEVLLDLKSRGLTKAPKLAVCDGALGFQKAVDRIWGQMKIQRCWFHKAGNVLDKLPECMQPEARKKLRNIFLSDTKENAEKAFLNFTETYGAKYPKAAACLEKDHDDLLRFYDFPAEHWLHIRTTNPIESTFATVRLRHRSTKGNGSGTATVTMVFKLCREAEKKWRKINGVEKLKLVRENRTFVDGVLLEAA